MNVTPSFDPAGKSLSTNPYDALGLNRVKTRPPESNGKWYHQRLTEIRQYPVAAPARAGGTGKKISFLEKEHPD